MQVSMQHAELLTPAGMLPSRDAGKDGIATLSHGQTAQWLGAAVSLGKHGHEVRLAEKSWRKLAVNLERAHQEPAPSLLAINIMEDWAKQIGFCYGWSDSRQVYARVVTIARELAFEEVPDYQSFRDGWQGAHKRWQSLYAAIERSGGGIGGSACHCSFSAFSRRSDGAPHGAPSLSFSPHERTTLYADGCCLPRSRAGGWAYLIEAPSPRNAIRRAGGLHRTTNNRAELLAVIRGLESISPPASICIVTDSEYVAHGINEHLPGWKLRGWRAGFGRRKRPLQNADLWQRLDGLLEPHDVTCEWTKGHADCCQNRDCDQRARQAAEIQQERT